MSKFDVNVAAVSHVRPLPVHHAKCALGLLTTVGTINGLFPEPAEVDRGKLKSRG
jgi:hypothetical protein